MSKKEEPKKDEQATGLAVPAYMQQFMTQAKHDVDSISTASMSVPRISYRGKIWRFIEGGEEEKIKDPFIRVVVVGVEPAAGLFLKTYYETGYQPGSSDPPTCSSSDGIRPDMWVNDKKSDLCRNCKLNIFGSATSVKGGKSKACKDGKRLWVCKPDDLTKYYGLNIPVMSLKNLAEYGRFVSKHNMPLTLLITEIGLDDESEFPELTFKHHGFVEEKDVETVVKMNTDRPWELPESMRAMALPEPEPAKQISSGSRSGAAPIDTDEMKKDIKSSMSTSFNEILDQW